MYNREKNASYKASANTIGCSILCERANGVFGVWVFLECFCVNIVISLFYSETFSIAACERKHIAEPHEFFVSIFILFFNLALVGVFSQHEIRKKQQ